MLKENLQVSGKNIKADPGAGRGLDGLAEDTEGGRSPHLAPGEGEGLTTVVVLGRRIWPSSSSLGGWLVRGYFQPAHQEGEKGSQVTWRRCSGTSDSQAQPIIWSSMSFMCFGKVFAGWFWICMDRCCLPLKGL